MCQPPEITLHGGGDAIEAATSNEAWNSHSSDGWVSPSPRGEGVFGGAAQGTVTWREDGLHATGGGQEAGQGMNTLQSHGQSLFVRYGQHQQQQQQQRAAQLAAMAAMGGAPAPLAAAWAPSLGQNLAEKLQRAAAAAPHTHAKPPDSTAAASLPWLARQGFPAGSPASGPAPTAAMWSASPVVAPRPGAPLIPSLAPQLVAQGIPLGMAQLGQLDMYASHPEEDEELDPKKYKRMMSNRASAKRSRQRRQERLDELEIVSAKLQVENATVQRRLNEANDRIRRFQQENEALHAELRSLKEMMGAKGVTTTSTDSHPDTSPGTMTKQDSCGPNGSTTDNPSEPSSAPSQRVTGKRRHDEVAESRFQSDEGASQRKAKTAIPVTPSSEMTSDSAKAAAPPQGPAEPKAAQDRPHQQVLLHQEMGILDDDLFTTFMDECFEAKPSEAALARH